MVLVSKLCPQWLPNEFLLTGLSSAQWISKSGRAYAIVQLQFEDRREQADR